MILQPQWVVGFTDGEGCFYVGINKHPEMTAGYQVLPEFRIVQHHRDIQILYALKKFFKSGVVRKNHDDRYELRIRNKNGLKTVVDFFQRHVLKTKKNVDYKKFADIMRLMESGAHLQREGIIRIAEIASKMNTGRHIRIQEILLELKNG